MKKTRGPSGSDPNLSRLFADSWCFARGAWIRRAELCIAADDIGFRQGVVAVERLRTYRGRPFQVTKHLDRWRQTTAALRIAALPNNRQLRELLHELLERNGALTEQLGDIGITIVATPGLAGAAAPTLATHLNAIDHAAVQRRRREGQALVVTGVRQPGPACWPREIKVRARIHYYLADIQARQTAADALGVLLDEDGSITETGVANLVVVSGGRLISPPPGQVLPGVTQEVVESLARDEQLSWDHRPIWPQELAAADEILLTGTDTGLWFASALDGRSFGEPGGGPIFHRLLQRFDRITVDDPK